MADLWNRDATVTAGSVKIPMRQKGDTIMTSLEGSASYSPILPYLRFVFKVEKTRVKHPNSASLVMYNLNETHRKSFVKGQPLVIEAGYVGSTSLLFKGEITKAFSNREGVDWITTVESGDGAAINTARLSKSYNPGTTYKKVIDDLVKTLKVGTGNLTTAAAIRKQLTDFAKGFSTSGPVQDALDKVVGSMGLQWSVQDGQLQILAPNDATMEPVVVLNSSTGLIGTPEMGEAKGQKKSTVSFRSLLQGSIRPGRRVQLESSAVKGIFICDRVTHDGDSYGQDWYTDCEALLM
jgi:hypothetical protein